MYSRPRLGTRGGYLKPIISKTGYPVVMLAPSRIPSKVHRLVAEAFIPNPDNLPFINHKDGDKVNSHYLNLEWCTAKENAIHAHSIGLTKPRVGVDNRSAKLSEEDVRYIRDNYVARHRSFGARALGRKFGISHNTVIEAVTGITWRHVK